MSDVSVIISAAGAAEDLPRLLERLGRQTLAPAEIVVCVDGHRSEIDRMLAVFRRSHAGIQLRTRGALDLLHAQVDARGAYVAFLEPDVLPEPQWVAAIEAGGARYPDAATLIGPVSLAFDAPEPEWLAHDSDRFMRWLGRFELGSDDLVLGGDDDQLELPTSNLVLRKNAFDPDLAGCTGLRDGDEGSMRQLIARLHARGAVAGYLGAARSVRRVPRERIVPRWFVLRAFAEGRASAAGLASLRDVLPAASLSTFATTKGDELVTILQRLEMMGVSFCRLPLRSRAELSELLGLVMGLHRHGKCAYPPRLLQLDAGVLDGDAPEEFLGWLDEETQAQSAASRTSAGAA